jgi:thiosulfate/3-mercaptopyruvate sulfurtransferase
MNHHTLVSAETLFKHLDQADWVLFDARFSLVDAEAGIKAYRQGHLPNARYVHLNDDLSSPVRSYTGRHPLPNFSQLSDKLGLWGVNHRSQVVVYDDASGAFAGRLWWLLRCMGHERVAVLDGGLRQWQSLNLPMTTHLPRLTAQPFRCYLDESRWLNANQVEDDLARGSIKLIDARTVERFQGVQEPIDPVAGHVPKALNRPFQKNLHKNGLFLPATELKNQFQALLGENINSEQVVHMCGSGVTACHNLLAMEIAGLKGSKLYAGSWSEWITNANRSVCSDTTAI